MNRPDQTSPQRAARRRALDAATAFCDRILPGALRRLSRWKSMHLDSVRDAIEDVRQDILVDALENSAAVCRLERRALHARWLSMAQRSHYRLRERDARQSRKSADDSLPNPQTETTELGEPHGTQLTALPEPDRELVSFLLDGGAQRHANGRICKRKTAPILGVSPRSLARSLERAAHQLVAVNTERIEFWRRRIGEALLGLAADRLRQQPTVRVLDETHTEPPDLDRRWRRLERAHRQLAFLPIGDPDVQSSGSRDRVLRAPCSELVEMAERLAPGVHGGSLWAFEAALCEGDIQRAAAALRRTPLSQKVRRVLARARLLEARRHLAAAASLLRRAATRHPADSRIDRSLRSLCPVPLRKTLYTHREAESRPA